jgi:hypothetical protein
MLDRHRVNYADFGPTLAREKLFERHGLLIGHETLRGLMRDAGLFIREQRAARLCSSCGLVASNLVS